MGKKRKTTSFLFRKVNLYQFVESKKEKRNFSISNITSLDMPLCFFISLSPTLMGWIGEGGNIFHPGLTQWWKKYWVFAKVLFLQFRSLFCFPKKRKEKKLEKKSDKLSAHKLFRLGTFDLLFFPHLVLLLEE